VELKARIKWRYLPADFFESAFNTEHEGVSITIEDGQVIAELSRSRYENDQDIRLRLSEHIRGLFEGVRLFSHEDFTIEAGVVEKDRPDGGKDLTVSVKPAILKIIAGRADVKVTDRDGNVTVDTRQERIMAKQRMASLIATMRGTDQTLDAMLESYGNAVRDPADELVHLYEIREALVSRFGSESQAIEAIAISRTHWSTLGKLANNEPLNQGRHRGQSTAALRDATQEELDEARSIAREMIEEYASQVRGS
jgi:hypothetical protein